MTRTETRVAEVKRVTKTSKVSMVPNVVKATNNMEENNGVSEVVLEDLL